MRFTILQSTRCTVPTPFSVFAGALAYSSLVTCEIVLWNMEWTWMILRLFMAYVFSPSLAVMLPKKGKPLETNNGFTLFSEYCRRDFPVWLRCATMLAWSCIVCVPNFTFAVTSFEQCLLARRRPSTPAVPSNYMEHPHVFFGNRWGK